MLVIEFKPSTKKIHVNGKLTPELTSSLKQEGYRSSGKGELSCTHDIYLSTKHMLGNIYESEGVLKFLSSLKALEEKNNLTIKNYLDKNLGPFKLFPYQEEFVYWYNDPNESPHAAFNACEPGLGKSIQALAAIFVTKPNCPLIILCPKNAVGVWTWHLKKYNYSLPIELGFRPGNCACICTYDSLPPKIEEAINNKQPLKDYKSSILPETVLIADEFHLVKNPKAIKTGRFRELFKYIREKNGKCIALTGTPVLNRCTEFKTLLDNLDLFKKTFGNAVNFYDLFGGEFNYYLKRMVWDESKRKPAEIKERVKKVLFIRKKEEVLDQIPEKIHTVIPVEITKKSLIHDLDVLSNRFKTAEEFLKSDEITFSNYTRFRSAMSSIKTKILLEKVEYFEEVGKPLIVFSDFVEPVRLVGGRQGWGAISGETSAKERTRLQEAFNKGELKGLAITIKAGGTALSLTSGDSMLFVDLNLVPGLNVQAKNRMDRVNKQKSVLFYYYLMADHAFEKQIQDMLLFKETLVKDII